MARDGGEADIAPAAGIRAAGCCRREHRTAAGRVAWRGAAAAALVRRGAGARARSQPGPWCRAHASKRWPGARAARPACCCCTARWRTRAGGVSSRRSLPRRTAWSRCRSPAWAAPTGARRIRCQTMADEAMAVGAGVRAVRRAAAAAGGGPLVRRLRVAAVRAAARRASGRRLHARHATDVARAAAGPHPARPARRRSRCGRPSTTASLAAALARFRFAPEQPCENLFIADHIARTSLKASPVRPTASHRRGPGASIPRWRRWARATRRRRWPRRRARWPSAGAPSPRWSRRRWRATWASWPGRPRRASKSPAARHHVMVDQPLALVSALRALLQTWPGRR